MYWGWPPGGCDEGGIIFFGALLRLCIGLLIAGPVDSCVGSLGCAQIILTLENAVQHCQSS